MSVSLYLLVGRHDDEAPLSVSVEMDLSVVSAGFQSKVERERETRPRKEEQCIGQMRFARLCLGNNEGEEALCSLLSLSLSLSSQCAWIGLDGLGDVPPPPQSRLHYSTHTHTLTHIDIYIHIHTYICRPGYAIVTEESFSVRLELHHHTLTHVHTYVSVCVSVCFTRPDPTAYLYISIWYVRDARHHMCMNFIRPLIYYTYDLSESLTNIPSSLHTIYSAHYKEWMNDISRRFSQNVWS